MENKLTAALVILLGVSTMVSAQQDLSKGVKDTVFVGDLKVAPSVMELSKGNGKSLQLKRISETLESQFISALNGTRQFQLLDRKRLGDIREEQKLTELGQIDPNDKNAAKAMKLAGAKYAFLPQLDAFEDRTEVSQYQQVGRTSINRKLFLSGVVQIVDTTTGMLLPDSPSVQLEKLETIAMAQQGTPLESDQALVMLAKEMANQLCQKVIGLLRPAKVLIVTGKQIMINRGTEAGFNAGNLVEVYAVQEIVDNDTGEKFRNEVPVGQAKVIRGDSKQSFAMIEGDDMGIQKDCVVRVTQVAPLTPQQGGVVPATPQAGGHGTPPGSSDKPLKFE